MAVVVNFGDSKVENVGGSGLRAVHFEITLPRNPAFAASSSWCGFPSDGVARVHFDKIRLEIKLLRGGNTITICDDSLAVLCASSCLDAAAFQTLRFGDWFSRKGDSITLAATFELLAPLIKSKNDVIEVTLRVQENALGRVTPAYESVALSPYDNINILIGQSGNTFGNPSTSVVKMTFDEPHPNAVEFATPIYKTHYFRDSQLNPEFELMGDVALIDLVSNRFKSWSGLAGYENSDGVRVFNSAVLKADGYTDDMTSEEIYSESFLTQQMPSAVGTRHNHFRLYADTINRLKNTRLTVSLTNATDIVKNMNTYVHYVALYTDGRMIAEGQRKEDLLAQKNKEYILDKTPSKYKKEAAKAMEM